jgi:hypothetical protein
VPTSLSAESKYSKNGKNVKCSQKKFSTTFPAYSQLGVEIAPAGRLPHPSSLLGVDSALAMFEELDLP